MGLNLRGLQDDNTPVTSGLIARQVMDDGVESAVSAHALDTNRGRPGAGIKVTLEYQQDEDSFVVVGEEVTNEDGRVNNLYPSNTLDAGIYRITFYPKSYFDKLGQQSFYDSIPVVLWSMTTRPMNIFTCQSYCQTLLIAPTAGVKYLASI